MQNVCRGWRSICVWVEWEWVREVCCPGERRWAWVVSGPFNSSGLSNWKQGFWTFTPREKLIKSQRDRRLRTLCSTPFVRDSISTLTFHQTFFLTIPWVRCLVQGACRERHDSQLQFKPTAIDTAMEREWQTRRGTRLPGFLTHCFTLVYISFSGDYLIGHLLSNNTYRIVYILCTPCWMCLLLSWPQAQRMEHWPYSFVAPWYFKYWLNLYFQAGNLYFSLEHTIYVDITQFLNTSRPLQYHCIYL